MASSCSKRVLRDIMFQEKRCKSVPWSWMTDPFLSKISVYARVIVFSRNLHLVVCFSFKSGANIFFVSFLFSFMIPELHVSVLPVLHYAYICAAVNTSTVLSKVFQILADSGEEYEDGLRKGIINRCIFVLVTVYFNLIEHSWKKKSSLLLTINPR